MEKIVSYLGFCLRQRKLRLGTGAIELLKSGVYLVVVCSTASENTLKTAIKQAKRLKAPLAISKMSLADAVGKENCKIAAVEDKSLAAAILKEIENGKDVNFSLFSEEDR